MTEDSSKPKTQWDPSLDVTSDQFDPLKALYAPPNLIKPVKNARLYDNVRKYESTVASTSSAGTSDAGSGGPRSGQPPSGAPRPTTSKKPPTEDSNPFQRKFQPHQLMLPGTGPKARHKRNLLDRMADPQRFEGPLAAMHQYMTEGRRVMVYTRNATGLLGRMTGRLEMFDKHWNLALIDVHEVWKRRKAYQCETAHFDGDEATADADECVRRLRELRLRLPEVQVKSLNRKYVQCSRRLAKAMVRGEQVILVAAMSGATVADIEAAPLPPSRAS